MHTLAEKVLLFALDDDKGTVRAKAGTALPYGLTGAMLIELVLLERLDIRDEKLVVTNGDPTGHQLLDQVMKIVSEKDKPQKIDHWISSLTGLIPDLEQQLKLGLIEDGILMEEKKKILWLFTVKTYPMVNREVQDQAREELRSLLMEDEMNNEISDLDPTQAERLMALLPLLKACDLMGEVFSKDEYKEAEQQVKNMMEETPFATSVRNTVVAIEAAVLLTITTAAITASTTTTTNS